MTTTVFIHDTAIRVRDPYAAGHAISALEAEALNRLWLTRYIYRAGVWLKRNGDAATPAVTAQELARIAREAAELSDASADASGDPIHDEALQLARDMILVELAKENLPPPPSLDEHAEQLLEARGDLWDRARKRVELRREVMAQTLNALELSA